MTLPTSSIRVRGHLSAALAAAFEGAVVVELPDGVTELRMELDQAALHGVITHIRDLGLPLLSIDTLEPASCAREQSGGLSIA